MVLKERYSQSYWDVKLNMSSFGLTQTVINSPKLSIPSLVHPHKIERSHPVACEGPFTWAIFGFILGAIFSFWGDIATRLLTTRTFATRLHFTSPQKKKKWHVTSRKNRSCEPKLSGWLRHWREAVNYSLFLRFYCAILQWIWVGFNLNCIDVYAVLEGVSYTKLYVFNTNHKTNTYSEY